MSKPMRVTYVWISGQDTYHDLRSKDRTVALSEEAWAHLTPSHIPEWNFDGSSTKQATGLDTEIIIRPVAVFKFQGRFVALCDCYFPNGTPTPCNTRHSALATFSKPAAVPLKPWFGIEQEYIILKNGRPLGWPERGFPAPQGNYYCGTGADRAYGREFVDRHYDTCLEMGLKISGTNAEVTPGQWEFQVGPCLGIESGDHVVMARWVFARLMEEFSVRDGCEYTIEYHPKPIKGDWNGSGLHTNYSTSLTRDPSTGMEAIMTAIENLRQFGPAILPAYGADNHERLTGKHETSSLNDFTFGVGTRGTSIRIPNQVQKDGHGYFEDRRPAANADPYKLTATLFEAASGFTKQA